MKYSEIEWDAFDGPIDYQPKDAAEALRLVRSVDSRRSAGNAYDKVLAAVGNNHAGTFYPAALRAAEELRELREHFDSHWVRWVAAEILTDWRSSFRADVDFEFFELPSGERCDVQRQVKSLARAEFAGASALRAAAENQRPDEIDLLVGQGAKTQVRKSLERYESRTKLNRALLVDTDELRLACASVEPGGRS